MKQMNSGLAALFIVGCIFAGANWGYHAYQDWRNEEYTWNNGTSFQIAPGTKRNGHFIVWSKEYIVNGKPNDIITMEFDCSKARWHNLSLKTTNPKEEVTDVSESPWVQVQPDTYEAKILGVGCKSD
jgi:hypothetical protein